MTDMKLDHLPANQRVSESVGTLADEVARAEPTPPKRVSYRFSNNRDMVDVENPHATP